MLPGSGEIIVSDTGIDLIDELQAPVSVRRFGSGWYSGFFGLLFALSGLAMVLVLRYPDWLGSPELAKRIDAASSISVS